MKLQYWNPTRRIFGPGSIQFLPRLIETFSPKHILLVLGKSSFKQSSHYQHINNGLNKHDIMEISIPKSPTVKLLNEVLKNIQGTHFNLVIGIGGGSVLDSAKTVAAILPQKHNNVEAYIEKRQTFMASPIACIAIPTTSGSGSEVTPYASIETDDQKKISLSHPHLYPTIAIIDSELTHSAPAYLTASTGFDALSQAIESFWARSSTPLSQTHALRAIPILMRELKTVIAEPYNKNARDRLSLASMEAGIAISQTRTTACHAISYPITTLFNVPHGHACALTLSSFLRFNAETMDPSLRETLLSSLEVRSAEEGGQKIEHLMDSVGLERSLSKLNIDERGIETIVENGFRPDRMDNNPRVISVSQLYKLLKAIE